MEKHVTLIYIFNQILWRVIDSFSKVSYIDLELLSRPVWFYIDEIVIRLLFLYSPSEQIIELFISVSPKFLIIYLLHKIIRVL